MSRGESGNILPTGLNVLPTNQTTVGGSNLIKRRLVRVSGIRPRARSGGPRGGGPRPNLCGVTPLTRFHVSVENSQVSCSQDAASPNIDGATQTARSQKEEGLPIW